MQAVLVVYRVVCRYFTADWENWGENDRMSEGWGAGKGLRRKILTPYPLSLPLPQFFFLSPTLGKFFTSPQLSTISRWRPEQPMEIYIHSPHQNPPALQARNSTNMLSLLGGVIGDDCGSMTTQPVQHETAVKRLSMREKLPGDRIVRFEKPCMWMWLRLRLLVG